jgi:hypothetical protein
MVTLDEEIEEIVVGDVVNDGDSNGLAYGSNMYIKVSLVL